MVTVITAVISNYIWNIEYVYSHVGRLMSSYHCQISALWLRLYVKPFTKIISASYLLEILAIMQRHIRYVGNLRHTFLALPRFNIYRFFSMLLFYPCTVRRR